jgi:tetratricopeptide (TPR) repeat protein
LAVLFAVLLIALAGVFVVLPRWAAGRPPEAVRATPVPPTAAPSPESDGSATVAAAVRTPPADPTPRVQRPANTGSVSPAAAAADKPDFVTAMSRGLAALESGQWQIAREAFESAASLRPGAPEVADGLARAGAGERRSLVSAGIRRGLELETSEAWAEAVQVYAGVLAVDPEAAAALDGRDRADRRANIDVQLEYHINNPQRLSSPPVFEDAAALLARARELDPRGPRLEGQLSRLEEVLATASTPVPVVVVSDDRTEVVIYRVGRLGTFSRRELSLRPGTYTAVGSREGFRDIRVQFTVGADALPGPVTVVCTEAL